MPFVSFVPSCDRYGNYKYAIKSALMTPVQGTRPHAYELKIIVNLFMERSPEGG